MRRSLRAPALAIALVVLAASGTGCGGSDDGSSDAGKPTTTVKLSGPPVKIVSIQGDLTKDLNLPGLRAGVAAVNAAGGVHGRRIELEVCFDKNDANTAARCARDAVADSSVIATVSNQNNFGTTVNPVLESAGMASVGSEPYTQSDFTSKVIFPTAVGGLSVAGAAAVAADVVDAKRIVLPVIDVTAGRTLPPLIDAGVLAPRGMKLAATVPVPLTAADVSAQAAAVTDAKPDAILFALTPDIGQRFIQALLQQGSKRPFVFP
ncbi:MAG TPA: ABC transporter substrate-binding protein, partial [Acidimicrobiales bacterium]|nr:ABC transporter substrate-binding protein [Acidimicrobiales bacterium]